MTLSKRVFVVSAVRTPIGSFGGSLIDYTPGDLGKVALTGALGKIGVQNPKDFSVDEVIVGNVLGAGHGMNIARQIALKSGLSSGTPAYTVNKVCGSGLKSITLGANEINSGNAECIIAGGVESMSQAGFISMQSRWGARIGNTELKDLMINDGLTDVFNSCHMGITAENIAQKFQISRLEQDEFSLRSQKKAKTASEAGYFKEEIISVPLMKRGKQVGVFEKDEHPRADTTIESLSALKPAFKNDGTVTAGNASGINDGSAFLVLVSEEKLKKLNIEPLCEIIGWASGGVDPEVMGLGPIEAVRKLCKSNGFNINNADCIESNEAFAVQSIAVDRTLEWDTSKVNVCGGAIALGHPIGASGARIVVTLIHQMKRLNAKNGIATLCVGGGQGIAVLLRR